MTDIIDSIQLDGPGALIDLIEIELPGSTIYLHPGLENGVDSLFFPDRLGQNIKEYLAIPLEMDGLEFASEGAMARPTLTVANILNGASGGGQDTTLFDELVSLGELTNEYFVGRTITRRRTLKKHLAVSATAELYIAEEMPIAIYIIDRIAAENNVTVTFELSSPLDVEGVQIPNRIVVGKYCPWAYQGLYAGVSHGGCSWRPDSTVERSDGVGGTNTHPVFYDLDNRPIVSQSVVTMPLLLPHAKNDIVNNAFVYWRSNIDGNNVAPAFGDPNWTQMPFYQPYNPAETYPVAPFLPFFVAYFHNDHLWIAKQHVPLAVAPAENSAYWERVDLCSKTLTGCKARFNYNPMVETMSGLTTAPSVDPISTYALPFGGFPTSAKFR